LAQQIVFLSHHHNIKQQQKRRNATWETRVKSWETRIENLGSGNSELIAGVFWSSCCFCRRCHGPCILLITVSETDFLSVFWVTCRPNKWYEIYLATSWIPYEYLPLNHSLSLVICFFSMTNTLKYLEQWKYAIRKNKNQNYIFEPLM